jgi:DNA polymerase III delta' subunit
MTTPQVFYRKWRPQRFEEVAGQPHVTATLRRAVATGRVAHAYLFTGPRGVGKTSTARIVAKALNCVNPQDGEPDNTCANCQAVLEDRMLDLIEIDAASNTGVDNIRDLREKVRFQPVAGRWKVYIIDEAHMLSNSAFNALLKTLEEPPPRVVMVLATTDVHKMPLTVVSRCQRYDFRRLSNEDVVDRLAEICGEEGIECEPEVLAMIARHAWGSLRDAENVLEQLAVSYGGLAAPTAAAPSPAAGQPALSSPFGGESHLVVPSPLDRDSHAVHPSPLDGDSHAVHPSPLDGDSHVVHPSPLEGEGEGEGSPHPAEIKAEHVRELLGLGDTATAIELAQAVLAGDAARALGAVNREAGRGADLRNLRNGTVDALRCALLLKAGVQDALSHPAEVVEAMKNAGRTVQMGPILHALAALGQADMKGDSSSPLALELAALRAAAGPVAAPSEAPARAAFNAPLAREPSRAPGAGQQRTGAPAPSARAPAAPPPRRGPGPPAETEDADRDGGGRQSASAGDPRWSRVTFTLRRTKFRQYVLGSLLRAAEAGEPADGKLVLKFKSKTLRQNIEEELQDARAREAVEKAVADAYGAPLKVMIEAGDSNGGTAAGGQNAAAESPLVRAALAMGARVIGEGPSPTENS